MQILRGIRFPELLEWNDQRLAHSYVLPDEALADVVLPTEMAEAPGGEAGTEPAYLPPRHRRRGESAEPLKEAL